MAKKDLSLASRAEDTRDAILVPSPVQFSLSEIKQHFTDSMSEVKAQYEVAELLQSNKNEVGCKTIWMSQVVLAEGLLDFYIHEISKYCMFRMFSGLWEKSEQYESFPVPMVAVEMAIDATKSSDWFFGFLNDRFSRDVFLATKNMRKQLNLIGIGFGSVMTKAFPCDTENQSDKIGAKEVEALFERRNKIAHQNDRSHDSAKQADISREFVEEYIAKIENIVNAIHMVAEEKDGKPK